MSDKNNELTQRQQDILEELKKCEDEMSGQQIHRALQDGSSNMGLTTVYRNLRWLQQKGLIRCRNLPTGEVLYAQVDRDHHHLTCVDCGTTMVLQHCPLRNIDFKKDQIKNFKMLFHTLEFFGLCQSCYQKQKST